MDAHVKRRSKKYFGEVGIKIALENFSQKLDAGTELNNKMVKKLRPYVPFMDMEQMTQWGKIMEAMDTDDQLVSVDDDGEHAECLALVANFFQRQVAIHR